MKPIVKEESELIKKMREAALETKKWPKSMKIMSALRLKADDYFRRLKDSSK